MRDRDTAAKESEGDDTKREKDERAFSPQLDAIGMLLTD